MIDGTNASNSVPAAVHTAPLCHRSQGVLQLCPRGTLNILRGHQCIQCCYHGETRASTELPLRGWANGPLHGPSRGVHSSCSCRRIVLGLCCYVTVIQTPDHAEPRAPHVVLWRNGLFMQLREEKRWTNIAANTLNTCLLQIRIERGMGITNIHFTVF